METEEGERERERERGEDQVMEKRDRKFQDLVFRRNVFGILFAFCLSGLDCDVVTHMMREAALWL